MASLIQEFAEARKRRLQERADFLVDSQLASEARQEEIQNRSNQMSQHLQDLFIARTEQAIEDSAQRAQDVRTRTFKTRSLLKHIHRVRIRTSQADSILRQQIEADRLATAEADREQRQQQVQERAAFTQTQLEDSTKTRLANATFAAQQRLEVESSRRADAQEQALKLSAFRSNLRDSVWGTSPSAGASQAPTKISATPFPV